MGKKVLYPVVLSRGPPLPGARISCTCRDFRSVGFRSPQRRLLRRQSSSPSYEWSILLTYAKSSPLATGANEHFYTDPRIPPCYFCEAELCQHLPPAQGRELETVPQRSDKRLQMRKYGIGF